MDTKTKIILFIFLLILVVGCGASFFLGRLGKDKIAKQLDRSVAESGKLRKSIEDVRETERAAREIIAELKHEQQSIKKFAESVRKENIYLKRLNRQDGIIIDGLSKSHKEFTSTIIDNTNTVKEIREIVTDSLQAIQDEINNE